MILKIVFLMLILNMSTLKLLHNKRKTNERILSDFEDYENSKSVNSMRMLMTNVKRDAEIKNF